MKTTLTLVALLFAVFVHAQKNEWKEMHDFHGVMSKTFHPAEEDNLQPVKDSAAVLVQKARQWQQAKVPAGYKTGVVKPILKTLVADCEKVRDAVQQGKEDAELKSLITKAHDTFHEIMEKCRE